MLNILLRHTTPEIHRMHEISLMIHVNHPPIDALGKNSSLARSDRIQVWDMRLRISTGRLVLGYSCTVTER